MMIIPPDDDSESEEEEEIYDPTTVDPTTLTLDEIPHWLFSLATFEPIYDAPINIDLLKTIHINLSDIEWYDFDEVPRKMKITNTGYSIHVGAKFHRNRPSVKYGPLVNKFIFSHLHFHWGSNDSKGSEHAVDNIKFPLELHLVCYNEAYLTPQSAAKHKDGIVIFCYLAKLQEKGNAGLECVIKALMNLQEPLSSYRIDPIPISTFIHQFNEDYFLYYGTISTEVSRHTILWLICRVPIAVKREQTIDLRTIFDVEDNLMMDNFRELNEQKRRVYHVRPSKRNNATMLPMP